MLQNVRDIDDAIALNVCLDVALPEYVSIVECEQMAYVNALLLRNNEFGINVFIPMAITPMHWLDDLRD